MLCTGEKRLRELVEASKTGCCRLLDEYKSPFVTTTIVKGLSKKQKSVFLASLPDSLVTDIRNYILEGNDVSDDVFHEKVIYILMRARGLDVTSQKWLQKV